MASAAKKRSSRLSGLATHIKTLDEKMGGLQPSDLIIIAGRPGMGKTAFATNIAFHIANAHYRSEKIKDPSQDHEGGIIGFFSLEMSSEQLATRIISEQTEVSSCDIRRGNLSEEQLSKIIRATHHLQKIPLYIDQTGGISLAQLSARARRLKRQHGLGVLVIDYIQLMTSSAKRSSENRVQEITAITMGLKTLAKELNIPIIALSQLSRQVENRTDKRPQLADLRESGSIEQDADVVLFVYRGEYYLKGDFVEEDFVHMAKVLNGLQGKFVLSLNDCDAVRDIFKDFDFLEVETVWMAGMAKKAPRKELLIHNSLCDSNSFDLFSRVCLAR